MLWACLQAILLMAFLTVSFTVIVLRINNKEGDRSSRDPN